MFKTAASILALAGALGGWPAAQAASIVVIAAVSAAPAASGGDFTGDTGFAGFPGIYAQAEFSAAESFAGQIVGLAGGFETIGGSPSGALLVPASANGVTLWSGELQGQTGSCGNDCTGEGAVSFSFAAPQSEIGLDILKIDGGSVTLQFFEPDGSAFDSVVVSGSGSLVRTFRAAIGYTIAGVSITNVDAAGVAYDNLRLTAAPIPEPSTLALLALGCSAVFGLSRRRAEAVSPPAPTLP